MKKVILKLSSKTKVKTNKELALSESSIKVGDLDYERKLRKRLTDLRRAKGLVDKGIETAKKENNTDLIAALTGKSQEIQKLIDEVNTDLIDQENSSDEDHDLENEVKDEENSEDEENNEDEDDSEEDSDDENNSENELEDKENIDDTEESEDNQDNENSPQADSDRSHDSDLDDDNDNSNDDSSDESDDESNDESDDDEDTDESTDDEENNEDSNNDSNTGNDNEEDSEENSGEDDDDFEEEDSDEDSTGSNNSERQDENTEDSDEDSDEDLDNSTDEDDSEEDSDDSNSSESENDSNEDTSEVVSTEDEENSENNTEEDSDSEEGSTENNEDEDNSEDNSEEDSDSQEEENENNSEANSEDSSDNDKDDSENEEDDSEDDSDEDEPIKDPFADEEDIPTPPKSNNDKKPRDATLKDIIHQLTDLNTKGKQGAIAAIKDLLTKDDEETNESFKIDFAKKSHLVEALKGVREMTDDEFGDYLNGIYDLIDQVEELEYVDDVEERKSKIKAWADDPLTAQELAAEDNIEIQKDQQAIKANEKEKQKYSKMSSLDDFSLDLFNAIDYQIDLVKQVYLSYEEPNSEYEDSDFIMRTEIEREIPDEAWPIIDIYFDVSGSWTYQDIITGMQAIASIKKFEDEGHLFINIFYWDDQVSDKKYLASVKGGTSGWQKVLANIHATKASNVMIMTDSDIAYYDDLADWNANAKPYSAKYGPSVIVDGCVWYLWKKGMRSPECVKKLTGKQGTYQYSF